jgi:alkanesulfonate monooxygenase SsuD/methylene tetrahydromethanopterin reductase-like flavin-dependent oxidoreductase (luciferase family)
VPSNISVGPRDVFDPWAILGGMAVATERVTIGAMVFSLARRRPWKVARESITVDHLSGGRLVIPVGLGGTWDGGYARVSSDDPDRRVRAASSTSASTSWSWPGPASRSATPAPTTR